jgi:hypothetical protein
MKSLKVILIYLTVCAPSVMAMDRRLAALTMQITDKEAQLLTSYVAFAREEKWAQDYVKIKDEHNNKLLEELKPRKARIMQKFAQIAPESIPALTDAAIFQTMEADLNQPSDEVKRCTELFKIMHLISVDNALTRTLRARLVQFADEHIFPALEKRPQTDDEIRYKNYLRLRERRAQRAQEEHILNSEIEFEQYRQKRQRRYAARATWEPLVNNLIPASSSKDLDILPKITALLQLNDKELLQRLAIEDEPVVALYENQDHMNTVLPEILNRLHDMRQETNDIRINVWFAADKVYRIYAGLQLRILQYAAFAKNELVEFEDDCTHYAITPNNILGMNDAMMCPLFAILPTTDLEGLLKSKEAISTKYEKLKAHLGDGIFFTDLNREPALKKINDMYEQLTKRMDLLQENDALPSLSPSL